MHTLRLAGITAFTMSVSLLAAGCGSGAKRIDPQGNQTVTTTSDIDIQDWQDAATRLSQSLLESDALASAGSGNPAIIATSLNKFVNNTTQHVDRDLLIKRIRIVLNKSGKAKAMRMTEEMKKKAFLEGSDLPEPDYEMELKIIEKTAKAGRTRQSAFVFQMSLLDPRTGILEWEDSTTIAKQGTRPAVGW